jgi:hypothetical protein
MAGRGDAHRGVALLRQRSLQAAELVETTHELVALGIVLAVSDVFVSVSDIVCQRLEVEILARPGTVGKHGQSTGSHFGKAADHDDWFALTLAYDGDNARPQQRDHRRMPGQHAEIAFDAGQIDLIDVTGEQHGLRRYEFEV